MDFLDKQDEAKYFLGRMIQEQTNRFHFGYNLSAFLSAARSVIQYPLKHFDAEAKKWHDEYLAACPILSFMKDKRNFNIHEGVIIPSAFYTLSLTEPVFVAVSAEISDGGEKIVAPPSEAEESPKKENEQIESSVKYRFGDWKGSEDVIALCEEYLKQLDSFISEAVSKGYFLKS